MIRFSIITVTFNAERYLKEALASVASQTFEGKEHWLIDGASCDGTLRIASEFPHLKVISEKDEGLSDAMNKGASHATGEFLLYLHADDRLADPHVLARLDTFLKQHSKAAWCYGQAALIDESGLPCGTIPHVPFDKKKLHKYNIIPHPSTLVSRTLFLKVGGFDKQLHYAMDYDLWLRLSALTPAYSLPLLVSYFRHHSASLSTAHPLNVAREAYEVRNRHCHSLLDRLRSYRTWRKRIKKIEI